MKKITQTKTRFSKLKSWIACVVVLIGFTATNVNAQYCAAGSTTNGCTTGDEYISHVGFNTINNTSACEAPMYADYTAQNTTITQSLSYTVNVTAADFFTGDQIYIWFDWNQNGVLTDAGEQFILSSAAASTGTILVPATATLGATRMRVRLNWTGAMSPCGNTTYGEVEDYTVIVIANAVCAGTPAPGNTLSTSNPTCANTAFTLSLQNATSGSGVTYQWQSSTNGVTYANIGGATNATYAATQTVAMYYQCVVTCSANSGTSTPVQVTMNTFNNCYCIPTTTFGCLGGDHITNVTVAGINNTTGTCLAASYSDYRITVAAGSATVGQTYAFSSHVNNGGTEYEGVWIDYDHSGTFDVSEFTTLTGVLGTDWIFTGNITIPVTALTGNTVMRVRSSYNAAVASNSACSNTYSYGETEDYTVNILPGPYDMGVLNLTAPVSPACYTTTEFVTATVKNFGTGPIDLTIHPVTVSCSVTGPNPMTFTNVVLNTGSIALGATQSVNFSVNYNMSVTGTYTFTASTTVGGDATTGNDTYTNSYIKSNNPTVVATPDVVALCAGQSTGILATGTSSIGIISYTWTPAAGLSSASAQYPLATPASTTTYSVTVVDVAGCVAMDTALLTIHQLPNVTANASTMTPCVGSNFTLFGSGAVSYMWDNGVTDNVPLAATVMTTYNVTGTDGFGCMNTNSITITPNALPTVTASASMNPVCAGSMETLNGGGASTYVWDNGVTDNVAFASSSSTTYNVTGTDVNGCTGTANVMLVVNPTSSSSQSMTICAGASITVGSSTYNTTGTYTDVFTGANGCDSTVTTNLTVSPAITGSQTIDVCAGGSVNIGGIIHTTTGIYTDVLTGGAANGCDSTVTTNLTVDAPIMGSQTVSVCFGGSITVNGNTYNSSGTFTDVITAGAANGCDSTVTTNLTVDPAITASQAMTICAGASVTVGTSTYTTSGTYTDFLANGAMNGCDSTITTNLTVSPAVMGSQTVTLCTGGMLMVGTSMYMASGTYTDVLMGAAMSGCDSTVTTNLTILSPITGSQMLNMCSGGSVTVNGNTYTTTGVYTDVLTGASMMGCDSTVTTNLTINSSISTSQTLTICAGDTILVGTNYYYNTGTYTDSLTALAGCDSVITTNLTVSLPLMGSQTLTICAGDSVMVGMMTHNSTGTYTDVINGMMGCDSTVTTNLTVSPAITGSQTLTICGGDSIMVGSSIYNFTGTFTDVLVAMSGCDSTVTTNLTVNGVFLINVNSPTICAGATATLTANGATTYTWSAGATSTGVNTATASPSATTTYTVTGTTGSCSNIGLATVIVNPLPTVTMAAFNPAAMCVNWAAITLPAGTPFGGTYSGAGVSGTMFTPVTAGVGAHIITYTYTDSVTTCSASATRTVTVNSCAGVEEYGFANTISVYPNPSNGMFTIAISNANFAELQIVITDIEGRMVYAASDKNIGKEYNKQLNLEGLAKGIYYIKLSNGTDASVQKLVVE